MLTGLATCGLCGSAMTLETGKGGRYVYYNCRSVLRQGTYKGQRVPAALLDRAVLNHLCQKLFTKDRVKAILRGIHKTLREADKVRSAKHKTLARRLAALQAKITRHYEMLESGSVDLQDVVERLRDLKIQRQLQELEAKSRASVQSIPLQSYTDVALQSLQKRIERMFLGTTDEQKSITKRYLKLFVDRLVVTLPRVDVFGKVDGVLYLIHNKDTAVGDDVPTAVLSWLPIVDEVRTLMLTPLPQMLKTLEHISNM